MPLKTLRDTTRNKLTVKYQKETAWMPKCIRECKGRGDVFDKVLQCYLIRTLSVGNTVLIVIREPNSASGGGAVKHAKKHNPRVKLIMIIHPSGEGGCLIDLSVDPIWGIDCEFSLANRLTFSDYDLTQVVERLVPNER